MTPRLTITAPPSSEPVTLQEAKLYLKIDHDAEDDVITQIIVASRDIAERYLQLALITRGASVFYDAWPVTDQTPWWDGMREGVATTATSDITLSLSPLQNVSAIKIHNDSGFDTISPALYYVDNADVPGRIVFKSTASLPAPVRVANGIEFSFTAGYGDNPEDIPPSIRQGILKLVAYLYTHRGDDADQAIAASGAQILFHPYRRMRLT